MKLLSFQNPPPIAFDSYQTEILLKDLPDLKIDKTFQPISYSMLY